MGNPKLIPYETIVRATSGEPEAVEEVLRHYSRRIRLTALDVEHWRNCSTRRTPPMPGFMTVCLKCAAQYSSLGRISESPRHRGKWNG